MRKLHVTSLLALMTLSTVVYATNFGESFLPNAPIRYFNALDMDMFTTTASKALDSAKDGTKVSWRNPDSTAHGYVIPSKTTHADGRTCRHLTIFNEVKQGKDQSAYKFCKIGGEWKIVS